MVTPMLEPSMLGLTTTGYWIASAAFSTSANVMTNSATGVATPCNDTSDLARHLSMHKAEPNTPVPV